jgi:hypothetical protein
MQTADGTDRWMNVGRSVHGDPRTAGAQATALAQADRRATLLLVFCPPTIDLAAMLDGICSVAADETTIAGCTTFGEIAPVPAGSQEPVPDESVVVIALGGPGFEAVCVADGDVSEHRRESGTAIAAAMERVTLPFRAQLILADGLSREQHEIVRGTYSILGASVPLVGGCSADQLTYSSTRQFHGTGAGVEVLRDAVVGVALGSSSPMGTGISHGWSKNGDAMVVTASEGGRVQLLDGESAAQVYWARVGPAGMTLDDMDALRESDPFAYREILFRHPLGLSRRSGEDLRVVHEIDVASGSIGCLADVPQGALAWTMTTDPDALIEAAATSCSAAVEGIGDLDPIGFLVFDCGARKLKLGAEGLRAEQEAIGKMAEGKPFGGFYTYGEIGRINGARGMHQLTVVTLALT